MNIKTKTITQAGLIAACYIALTLFSNLLSINSIRLSESLYMLACFTPAAIPGLFIGCLVSNIISGCTILDVVFGSLATLLGAIGTRFLRKNRYLACLPPILSNSIIVPLILGKSLGLASAGLLALFVSFTAGEIICAGLLGQVIYKICEISFSE